MAPLRHLQTGKTLSDPLEIQTFRRAQTRFVRTALCVFSIWTLSIWMHTGALAVWIRPPQSIPTLTAAAPAGNGSVIKLKRGAMDPRTVLTREHRRKPDTYTLLIAGRDRVGLNTDVIMAVRLDCRQRTLDVVSIPRDTLVNVPWAVKKANSIYGNLGAGGLKAGVEGLTGFPLDGWAVVNTNVFRAVIDCMGGIRYDVPIRMYYDDGGQDLHIHLEPGEQHLDGTQCEGVVRFRQNNDGTGYPDGDLGRIRAQHDFLKSAAGQLLKPGNIPRIPELIDILRENTDTDLTAGNLAFFARELLKLRGEDITFSTMPHDNVFIRGGSYVSVRTGEWLEMINERLNPYEEPVTDREVDLLTFSGGVLHATAGAAPGLSTFFDYESLRG